MAKNEIPKKQLDLFIADMLDNHIEDVRQLLNNNGVPANGLSKADLQIAFLKAVKDSESFRGEASRYMASLAQAKSNFTGVQNKTMLGFGDPDDWNVSGGDGVTAYQAAATGVAAPATSTGSTSSFWSTLGGVANQQNLNNLFGTGLDVLSTKLKSDANKGSEERALELERLRLQQIYATGDVQARNAALPNKGLSTGAIIGISLGGVAVIGLIVYLAVKK